MTKAEKRNPEVCQHVDIPLKVGFIGAARRKVTGSGARAVKRMR
jgi:hypothetical protein